MGLVVALATIAGFVLEWRQRGADGRRLDEHGSRIARLEERAAALEAWHDRVGRST